MKIYDFASIEQLDGIADVERRCFPSSEAASRDSLENRIKTFGNHFTYMVDDCRIIAYIGGMTTNEADLTDKMYDSPSMHDECGYWQMIFSVTTLPEFQKRGIATKLMKAFISKACEEGRKGVVLTCKEKLIPFYSKFGFVNEGVSNSIHGGVVWYQMRLIF